jgi:purine-binding chemotaxis protein CheW
MTSSEPGRATRAGLPSPQAILRERVLEWGRMPDPGSDDKSLIEVLEFRLAQERYAIETALVQEVMNLHHLTPMPCVPAFIRGIVTVRGHFTAVLDLKKFFELPDEGITDLHSVVLIESEGTEIGLLADSIGQIHTLSRSALQPPAPTVGGIGADYLRGATQDGLIVLDPARILQDPRLLVDEEVAP